MSCFFRTWCVYVAQSLQVEGVYECPTCVVSNTRTTLTYVVTLDHFHFSNYNWCLYVQCVYYQKESFIGSNFQPSQTLGHSSMKHDYL